MVEIPILDDLISEPTESFICVILRPSGEDDIVVEDPNTITIVIEDDDCEYSSAHCRHCCPYLWSRLPQLGITAQGEVSCSIPSSIMTGKCTIKWANADDDTANRYMC